MIPPIFVHDYLRRSALLHPDKTALVFEKERITYAELDRRSSRLARELVGCGVVRQDRIVIFLDNSPEIIVSLFGILKADAIFIVVNGGIRANKLAFILNDAGAAMLISHTGKQQVVLDAMGIVDRDIPIIWLGDIGEIPSSLSARSLPWDSIFFSTAAADSNLVLNRSKNLDLDLTALIYTSGTTGEPKGVMVSHFNMISAARSIIQHLDNTGNDIILDVLPLSFNYGLYQVIMAVMFGGTVVIEKSFTFIHKVLQRIAEENITGFPIVPTILAMILKLDDVHRYNLDSLRYITNTGAKLPVSHIRRFRFMFPRVKIYSMFGLTECKRVCGMPPDELDARPESVGKPMPNCEVFLVDDAGNEVGPGQIGELVVRGANVMKGYWNAPELTARVFRPGRYPGDTFLYSGDYFRRDADGYLYFVGRRDDIIKSKGERLNTKEIEDTLCDMEEIAEAAVIGVPDEIYGLAVKAFVVCRNGSKTGVRDILRHCRKYLEPYAIPKQIEILENLPKTDHGKTDKKALKQLEMVSLKKSTETPATDSAPRYISTVVPISTAQGPRDG